MTSSLQLDKYLHRIDFQGLPKPDLITLSAIQLQHIKTIPFENLNPFTGAPVAVNLPAVEDKLVNHRRGGYCFEQNKLLLAALQQIGYQVKGLAARVILDQPVEAITPRTHMLLLIDLDGVRHLADVGFGSLSPTAPLRLETDVIQTTAHEAYRLVRQDGDYRLEAEVKGEWKPLYKFHLDEYFEIDYKVMNWYTSCHPSSHFTHTLIAARAFDGGRYALRNTVLHKHRLGQASELTNLPDPRSVLETLSDVFGLDTTGINGLEERISVLFDK